MKGRMITYVPTYVNSARRSGNVKEKKKKKKNVIIHSSRTFICSDPDPTRANTKKEKEKKKKENV